MTAAMDDVMYWLWLQKCLGYNANIRELIRYFGSAKQLYEAGETQWRTCGLFGYDRYEINPLKIAEMVKTPVDCGESIVKLCRERNVKIVTPDDACYPEKLKLILDYPAVLYVRGDISFINHGLAVGVIGTRKPSKYGENAAKTIVSALARENVIIVSGGALGIDSISHRCAIEANSKTVLVMGCGHDADYLKENEQLRKEVEQHGAVISEYPPLTKASLFTFPKRNRIISGISSGVVIIEAGEKSGTLNTANHARHQNRDIFAVPGDITSGAYSGSNKLIIEGAKPIFSAADILNYYNYETRLNEEINKIHSQTPFELIDEFAYGKHDSKKKRTKKIPKDVNKTSQKEEITKENKKISNFDAESVSNNAKLVYNLMLSGSVSLDDITRESGLPVRKVLTALTELELSGAVEEQSGSQYVLI